MTQKAVKKSKGGKAYKMIAVSPETYDALILRGKWGDSMDAIINTLLDGQAFRPKVKVQVPRTYQCSECGVFVSTVVDPKGFECYNCKKMPPQWRTGDF